MLNSLVSLGKEQVGAEEITELLWPESDGDAVCTSMNYPAASCEVSQG